MPEYKIRIEMPQQTSYQLVFDATTAKDCRDKIMKFFRALGIATNVCNALDAMVASAVIYDHVRTYDLRITALPPAQSDSQPVVSDDLTMIRNMLKQLFGAVGGGGSTLNAILASLGKIKTDIAQKIAQKQTEMDGLADAHRTTVRNLESQRNDAQERTRTVEEDLRTSRTECHTLQHTIKGLEATVRELQAQIESLTKRLNERDTTICDYEAENTRLNSQLHAVEVELNTSREQYRAIVAELAEVEPSSKRNGSSAASPPTHL